MAVFDNSYQWFAGDAALIAEGAHQNTAVEDDSHDAEIIFVIFTQDHNVSAQIGHKTAPYDQKPAAPAESRLPLL